MRPRDRTRKREPQAMSFNPGTRMALQRDEDRLQHRARQAGPIVIDHDMHEAATPLDIDARLDDRERGCCGIMRALQRAAQARELRPWDREYTSPASVVNNGVL